MEKVSGIGGIFFKAAQPQRMAAWYRENLGIETTDGNTEFHWREKDQPEKLGRTVWALFPADTDYFATSKAGFMVNYRVTNLDRMVEQLRGKGVTVDKIEKHDYGKFAWVTDPEGNRIELWEPVEKG